MANSPQDVQSGSTFTLNRPMAIPEGSAAVYFQDAQLVAARGLKPNYAYCKFELDGPATAARQVSPQSFWVSTVDYDEQAAGPAGDAVSLTRMNLQTIQQAKGYSMTCARPRAAASARFVTVAEIQGALGDHFTLKPVR